MQPHLIRIEQPDSGILSEVTPAEAERLLKEAHARGCLVVDKRSGRVLDKLDPETTELLIINIVIGG